MIRIAIEDELELRQLAPSDAEALFELIDTNREHLDPYLPWVRSNIDVTTSDDFIKDSMMFNDAKTGVNVGIWYQGTLVGHIGIRDIASDGSAILGYWIAKSASGKGLVTKAVTALSRYSFDKMGLAKLIIQCRVGNAASSNVAKRAGYKLEGVEPQAEEWHDQKFDLERYVLHR